MCTVSHSHKQCKIVTGELTLTQWSAWDSQEGFGILGISHRPVRPPPGFSRQPPIWGSLGQAEDKRPDVAPCVLPRSASAAPRRWSPSPRSPISQPAAGLCPAACARSARAPASRYMAASPRCCPGAHAGARCRHPPPAHGAADRATDGPRKPEAGTGQSPTVGHFSVLSSSGHGVQAWGAKAHHPVAVLGALTH